MKRTLISLKSFVLASFVALCAIVSPKASFALDLTCSIASEATQDARVSAQLISGNAYLFLPSQADVKNLVLSSEQGAVEAWSWVSSSYVDASGGIDLVSLGVTDHAGKISSNGATLWVRLGGSAEVKLTVMQSANIRSVFVNTKHDISYVNSSANHSVSDSGRLTVLAPGSLKPVYDGALDAIRGRGNSTWGGSNKKPYQMKLSRKSDLLGTGEKTKTWLLLANAADPTLLRNTLSYKLALYLGSEGTPSCEPCDFYYNGEYRGSYLLTEKVKVEKSGVNIDNLDKANEDANEGSSAWVNPWSNRQWGTNSRDCDFSYVSGLNDPDDISGGYLVELDDKALPSSEVSMFYSKTHFFTVHTPEYATQDEATYVSELVGAAVDAAASGGTDPISGRTVEELFDLDSLLATGLVEDFVCEGDYLYSSSYFYVPRAAGKVFCGPVWDCDRSFDLTRASKSSAFAQSFLSGNSSLLRQADNFYRTKLSPVVRDVLLGDVDARTEDGSLHSLVFYRNQIAASQAMDQKVWGIAPLEDADVAYVRVDGKTWSSYVDDLCTYMKRRLSYQDQFYSQAGWKYCLWQGNSIDTWVPYLDGKACVDGWVLDGLNWYYMCAGGLKTGWLYYNGDWYWLNPSTGAMTTGWLWDGSNWYYARFNGKLQSGWQRIKDAWYYFDDYCAMATGWQLLNGSWYYLDGSGAMATGWRLVGGSWYYLSTSGSMVSGWQLLDDVWYYFEGSGVMATGWRQIGSLWYYFDGSGALSTGWKFINGIWYYFDGSGSMVTGWCFTDDGWYYFDANGAMVHDRWVGDYYLGSNGSMATNNWIGAFWVGEDGKWIPGYSEETLA